MYYDYSNIRMNWSGERRDKGQNQLHFLQPGELGKLFTDASKPADTSAPSQSASTPAPATPTLAPNTPTPAPATPTPAPAAPAATDLLGTWNGSYHPDQGESGMSLDVYEDNGKVLARWYFYSLPGKSNTKSGSVLMEVSYDAASGMYVLTTIAEDDQPQGYSTMSLLGNLAGDTFSGNSECAFSVKKGALSIPTS
ncbi:hypothetical protein LJC56_05600 [Christensenellaceae bacterium OttesenSCG-928-K19]|nr:hypothetical protein [Christensenellaceae bacterium OttesenSCG-928-K19]